MKQALSLIVTMGFLTAAMAGGKAPQKSGQGLLDTPIVILVGNLNRESPQRIAKLRNYPIDGLLHKKEVYPQVANLVGTLDDHVKYSPSPKRATLGDVMEGSHPVFVQQVGKKARENVWFRLSYDPKAHRFSFKR